VVVSVGLTVTLPDVAPPELKLKPTQESALFEDQVITDESPFAIELGVAVRVVVGEN
jgi:hypothetical protein